VCCFSRRVLQQRVLRGSRRQHTLSNPAHHGSQNGELVSSLERQQRQAGTSTPRVTLPDMNRAVGLSLAGVLLPTDGAGAPPVRDIVAAVCPQPSLRFAAVYTAVAAHSAFETDVQAWMSVASALAAAGPKYDALDGAPGVGTATALLRSKLC
jgi:hypothetical protein